MIAIFSLSVIVIVFMIITNKRSVKVLKLRINILEKLREYDDKNDTYVGMMIFLQLPTLPVMIWNFKPIKLESYFDNETIQKYFNETI